MKKPSLGDVTLVLLQVVLLAAGIATWWAQQNNTLFGNGRWIVGKDTGKFVFYTFGYMFSPLEHGRVDLSGSMAYQELLYHHPENDERRLAALEFDCRVSRDGYLWVLLQKHQQQLLGIRLSQNKRFPSGFYRHSETGDVVEKGAFTSPLAGSDGAWHRVAVTRSGSEWTVTLDGQPFGKAPATKGPEEGYIGFRGSGNTRAGVHLRNVAFHFQKPSDPARSWVERESFNTRVSPSLLLGAFIFSVAVVGLRSLRQQLWASQVASPADASFRLADNVAFAVLLAVFYVLSRSEAGDWFPAAILAGELIAVILLARYRRADKPPPLRPTMAFYVYAALITLLGGGAAIRHGEWLGRASRSIWAMLDGVHPSAFIMLPDQQAASTPFEFTGETTIQPGQPYFVPSAAFSEQVIRVVFTPTRSCTLDLVFQQQSYLTHGDPEGEPLPIQRRLLRLSTRDDVPNGLALATRASPGPFLKVDGTVHADAENQLEIRSTEEGVRVVLNGQQTFISRLKPLGLGETGLLVLDGTCTLNSIHVSPTHSSTVRAYLIRVFGFLAPFVWVLLCWLVLLAFGRFPLKETAVAVGPALFPAACYLIAASGLDRDTLLFTGHTRLAWLDLALAATAASHLSLLSLLRNHLKRAPLLCNLVLLLFGFFVVLYVWDIVLPPKHPLKLAMTPGNTAPGEMVSAEAAKKGPWYNNNRYIGANTYMWKQQFGGEPISLEKPDDTIRIFAMGGSQAWGSGAASSRDTYDGILERKLRALGLPVEIFNAGINGAGIGKVEKTFQGLMVRFSPDILILDVGLNDSAALSVIRRKDARNRHFKALVASFESLVTACETSGVEVVLSLEAISSESPLRASKAYYDTITTLTEEHGGRVVQTASAIREKENGHFVWWDTAHYAPFGHLMLARLLEPVVAEAVKERLAERGQ